MTKGHMTTSAKRDLDLRIYADKPRRRVPGTDVTAVTMRSSSDRTVREYVLFRADGSRLGRVSSHARRLAVAAGYHEGQGSYDPRRHTHYRNLTEAALGLLDKDN